MDLRFSDEDVAFRDEVRTFIRDNLAPELREKVLLEQKLSRAETTRWHRLLHERGWSAPKWPKQYGGTDWTPTQHYIFQEEMSVAPPLAPFAVYMVGPLLYTYGTDEQKARYLPPILSGDEWWCQGYSEPGAGSDLASLQTRAVRDGDDYVVNGQKIWTGAAHIADMMFCLVRTDSSGKKQHGISLLLIDMKSPGITVRPIVSIDGLHTFNEVYFDDVRVPVGNRVGEEHKGWTYAKFVLGHERTSISQVSLLKHRLQRARRLASRPDASGRSLLDDPRFRDRLATLEVDLLAIEYTSLRILSAEQRAQTIGPEVNLMKVATSEFACRATDLMLEALGYHGAVWQPEQTTAALPESVGVLDTFILARKSAIYGGTNEIQKNVFAKAALGL
jgi:alkylation response protein AidB-like acyl-CoA dehydrogenase